MPIDTYIPIAKTTLSSAQTTVTFSGITGIYTDLVLVTSLQDTTNGAASLRLNNDSGNNYSRTALRGNGSTASSFRQSNINTMYIEGDSSGGSNFAQTIVNIMNYSNTTTNKTSIARVSYPSSEASTTVYLWRSTAAVNRIDITSLTGTATLAIGSTFTLYGIHGVA